MREAVTVAAMGLGGNHYYAEAFLQLLAHGKYLFPSVLSLIQAEAESFSISKSLFCTGFFLVFRLRIVLNRDEHCPLEEYHAKSSFGLWIYIFKYFLEIMKNEFHS